jgi:septal ring factor EnvC (AmiA/AmiB activator)
MKAPNQEFQNSQPTDEINLPQIALPVHIFALSISDLERKLDKARDDHQEEYELVKAELESQGLKEDELEDRLNDMTQDQNSTLGAYFTVYYNLDAEHNART